MTLFLLLAAALLAISLAFLLLPLLRARRTGAPTERAANLSIYRDQFAELERDLASGVLTEDQYAQARVELESYQEHKQNYTDLSQHTQERSNLGWKQHRCRFR